MVFSLGLEWKIQAGRAQLASARVARHSIQTGWRWLAGVRFFFMMALLA
jgi:hypothetical protein